MRRGVSTTQALVLVLIAGLVLSLFTLLGREGGSNSASQAEVAATIQCAVHQWFNNITEALVGTFSNSKCSQPAFSDLSGTDQPSWANIQSFPAGCNTGLQVSTIDVTPTCSSFTIRTTSDVSTSSATYSTITGLSFTGVANKNYILKFDVSGHTDLTNPTLSELGISVMNLPAGATLVLQCYLINDEATVNSFGKCNSSTQSDLTNCGVGVGPDNCTIEGWASITMGANGGTIALGMRKRVGSGTTSAVVKAGSYISWKAVSP